MEVSGEPHVPVVLPPRKESPVAIESGAGGVLEAEWMILSGCVHGIEQLVT